MKTLTMTEAIAIVKAGRMSLDGKGGITVDGQPIRSKKIASILTNAAISNWVAG